MGFSSFSADLFWKKIRLSRMFSCSPISLIQISFLLTVTDGKSIPEQRKKITHNNKNKATIVFLEIVI